MGIMKGSNILATISSKILDLQFSIDTLLKEDVETDLMGRKLQAKLIQVQAEELLEELYQYQKNPPSGKDPSIRLNITAQNILLLNNQISLVKRFIECLDANRRTRMQLFNAILLEKEQLITNKLTGKKYE